MYSSKRVRLVCCDDDHTPKLQAGSADPLRTCRCILRFHWTVPRFLFMSLSIVKPDHTSPDSVRFSPFRERLLTHFCAMAQYDTGTSGLTWILTALQQSNTPFNISQTGAVLVPKQSYPYNASTSVCANYCTRPAISGVGLV